MRRRLLFSTDDPCNRLHRTPFHLRALPEFDVVFTPRRANVADLGPVVALPQWGLHAVMRYDEVRTVLRDWETYSSAAVGLSPKFNAVAGATTNILMSSPPLHHKLRSVLEEKQLAS